MSAADFRSAQAVAAAVRDGSTTARAETKAALARARASGLPSVLHCLIDPEAITPTGTLQGIRSAALARK